MITIVPAIEHLEEVEWEKTKSKRNNSTDGRAKFEI
jgi:hypothetical protein